MTQMVDIFAFPTPEYVEMANQTWGGEPVRHQIVSSGGMTLRDWFAGQALAGLIGNASRGGADEDGFAEQSYLLADAMLAARE